MTELSSLPEKNSTTTTRQHPEVVEAVAEWLYSNTGLHAEYEDPNWSNMAIDLCRSCSLIPSSSVGPLVAALEFYANVEWDPALDRAGTDYARRDQLAQTARSALQAHREGTGG